MERARPAGASAFALLMFCLIGPCGSDAGAQPATTLVPLTGKAWRYSDTGIDLGSAWQASVYSAETQWPSGEGLFGIESSFPYPYPVPLRTPLVLNAGRTTYYFRTHFNFSGPTVSILLLATAYVDDGAVVYLNGSEVGRVRFPAGLIRFETYADAALPEGQASVVEVPTGLLVQGDNVLAVEVHQSSSTSSDVVFGMSLETYTLTRPVLVDPAEPADRTVAEGDPVTLSVAATGYPAPDYQWFKNGLPVAGATGPTLVLPSVGAADAGNYFVMATNRAGSVTSRTAVVGFLADTTAPTILYAVGLPDLTEVLLVFSEPVDEQTAADNLNWNMEAVAGGPALDIGAGRIEDGTNVYLSTLQFREPALSYVITNSYPIPDLHGNSLPLGTTIPIASFTAEFISSPGAGGQAWRYNQSGTDLGTGWTAGSYDDSTWLAGQATFDGFRRFGGTEFCRSSLPISFEEVRTCLTLSNQANTAQIPTVYFRSHFRFDGDPSNAVVRLRAIVNDGAVFYLNGAELARVGMPAGPIAYSTLANRIAEDGVWEEYQMPAPSLAIGDNLLAAELHQQSLDSPDLTFALSVTGFLTSLPSVHPQLAVQFNTGSVELTWSPAIGTLQSAGTFSGPWTPVSVSNPPNRHVAPATDPQKFFRLTVP